MSAKWKRKISINKLSNYAIFLLTTQFAILQLEPWTGRLITCSEVWGGVSVNGYIIHFLCRKKPVSILLK